MDTPAGRKYPLAGVSLVKEKCFLPKMLYRNKKKCYSQWELSSGIIRTLGMNKKGDYYEEAV